LIQFILNFCIFHPQVCFVVNRRDRHHSIGYRAISRLTDACGHFIAGLAQAVQMRGPRDLLGNLDDVATRRRGWKIISAVAEWCAWPSPDGNHSSILSAACMSVVGDQQQCSNRSEDFRSAFRSQHRFYACTP
jgi:hypothetical protein